MKALISNLQRYSIKDGPGIRTTVFFMGCGMRCQWCHNPECLLQEERLRYFPNKCIGCGTCVKNCASGALKLTDSGIQYDQSVCQKCFTCSEVCPAAALTKNGRYYTVDELMEQLTSDEVFYKNSGGGVTFSGGECMKQSRFLREILIRCKEKKIHCTVDTAGFVDWENFEEISGLVDLFLYDVKSVDNTKHKMFTGVSNEVILENLRRLSQNGENIIIRIPVIASFNDSSEEMTAIASFLSGLKQCYPVELLGYHNLAEGKYRGLWKKSKVFSAITQGQLEKLSEAFKADGRVVKVYSHS